MSDGAGLIGRCLGDFIVREKIGEGGFGRIYRAEQQALEREAVIKVLRTDASAEEGAAERFTREAQLLTRIDHPYAAHVYAFGAEADGLLWIAMELCRGTPLSTMLETRGPIPVRRFAPFFEKLCEVVQSAHEHGIVHRDIKPANIMVLSRAGRLLPKLLDLGIAKVAAGSPPPVPIRSIPPPAEELPRTAPAETWKSGDTWISEHPAPHLDDAALSGAGAPAGGAEGAVGAAESRLLGSPAYMAPELWRLEMADARSDIYALGLVAFEALEGRPAVQGRSLSELAAAHKNAPLPEFQQESLAPVHKVLSVATAKRREERFATALELAAAFREACANDAPEGPLPRLHRATLERWLRDGPTPFADAVLLLDAARTAHHARDALLGLVRTTAHFVGVLALLCYERGGGRGAVAARSAAEGERMSRALSALDERELSEADWIEIVRATCLGYEGRPELHPIPELCAFALADPGGEGSLFDELISTAALAQKQSNEAAANALCAAVLPLLSRVLDQLSFLMEYELIVGRRGAGEVWKGAQRPRRTVARSGVELPDGHAALVDPHGEPIVLLWPLVRSAEPAPGVAEELFFFAGRARSGALLVAVPHPLVLRDDSVCDWLRERFSLGEHASADVRDAEERPPYLGLAAFSAADADLYLGREREVLAARNMLQKRPFFAVVGASGAGKSSFVMAGVLPALPEGFRAVVLRPGATPVAALCAALVASGLARDAAALRQELRADPEALARLLGGPRPWDTTVLVVDQLEEMFTLCLDPEERTAFAEAISRAAQEASDPVRVIVTLRDDFLVRAEHVPALRARLQQGLHVLTLPEAADLERVLVEPARRRGYSFDDPTLPRRMVAAVADKPGALALLSFTAARLWELRDTHFRKLHVRAYEAMGGVAGALASHAEELLSGMLPEEQRLTREALLRLVTSEGTREVLTRSELLEVLGGERAQSVIEKLVQARLLVTSEGEGAQALVEIIHEALLTAWPRWAEWRRESQEGARLRDQLRGAARQWNERGRPRGILWRGEALIEYNLWRSRFPMALTAVEEAFGAASLAEAARERRIVRGIASGAIALLAAIALLLWFLYDRAEGDRIQADAARHEAQVSEARAERVVTEQYIEQGRIALLRGDHARASVFLVEAYRRGAEGAGLRFLMAKAAQVLDKELWSTDACEGPIRGVEVSPDETQVLTAGECPTRIWNARTGALVRALDPRAGDAHHVRWSEGADQIVVSGVDSSGVYDAHTGALTHAFDVVKGGHAVALSRHGRVLVSGQFQTEARVWDTRTAERISTLPGHVSIAGLAVSPDGDKAVTADETAILRLWSLPDGVKHTEISTGCRALKLAWSPDGTKVGGVCHDNGVVVVWDAGTLQEVARFRGRRGGLFFLEWGGAGNKLLRGGEEGSIPLYEMGSNEPVAWLEGHTASIAGATFGPGDRQIATGGPDGLAMVWDASTGRLLSRRAGHSGVRRLRFLASGERLVTGGYDGKLKLWDVTPDDLLLSLDRHPEDLEVASFVGSGQRVATSSADGAVRFWDAASGALVRTLAEPPSTGPERDFDTRSYTSTADGARAVVVRGSKAGVWDVDKGERLLQLDADSGICASAFSPDGQRLAVATQGGSVIVWDARSGAELLRFHAHGSRLDDVAWSAQGERLVTVAEDGLVKVWSASEGREVLSLAGHRGGMSRAVFSPDGAQVVSAGNDKTIRIWDSRTGALLRTLDGHKNAVNDVKVSPDGALLASASGDNTVKIWEMESGKLLYSFSHTDLALYVSWSPDGRRLLSAGYDNAARIWDIPRWALSPSETAALVACRAPFALKDGLLTPARPSCR